MGDSFDNPNSRSTCHLITNGKESKNHLVASRCKSSCKSANPEISPDFSRTGKGTASEAAVFLLKIATLELVRRVSRARCPFAWCGLQALQVFCYLPFKWIQKWAPFKCLVNGMQTLSRPLLVLSIATAFSDQSGSNLTLDSNDGSQSLNSSQASSESESESSMQSTLDARILDEAPQSQSSTNWLLRFYAELKNQGISLPERIDEDELHRFYIAANGDFSCLLSSVKKTIYWRKTFKFLSELELEMWSAMVFWHGFDVKNRLCLIVRLGLACTSLSSHERAGLFQAIVSQVEHGILHLADPENPRITVLVDCEGLSPLRFPVQLLRSCSAIFQDHFPDRLGFFFIIRLPPVVRVIAQTFFQLLKPVTQQKLKIEGRTYHKALMDNFQTLPSFLGGSCTCKRCSNLNISNISRMPRVSESSVTVRNPGAGAISAEDMMPSPRPSNPTNMHMNGYSDHIFRSAMVGILIFWVLIAFVARIYYPEIRPTLPF